MHVAYCKKTNFEKLVTAKELEKLIESGCWSDRPCSIQDRGNEYESSVHEEGKKSRHQRCDSLSGQPSGENTEHGGEAGEKENGYAKAQEVVKKRGRPPKAKS